MDQTLTVVIALLAQTLPPPCTPVPRLSGAATIIIEVVDPLRLPLPGMEVRLKARRGPAEHRAATDADGTVGFAAPRGVEYDVHVVSSGGFKNAREKGVAIPVLSAGTPAESQPAVRVQIRLKFSSAAIAVD